MTGRGERGRREKICRRKGEWKEGGKGRSKANRNKRKEE